MLRTELHDLKDCQVKYFTFSITSAGLLLGLAVNFASGGLPRGTAYLFPLTILLPSWWIFFDKATTITRIVGYYRIIEKLILNTHQANFTGWENALEIFREKQLKGELKPKRNIKEESQIRQIFDILILRTTHRYWVVTYYTFLALSFLCLGLSYTEVRNNRFLYFASFIVLITLLWNFNVILQLISGKHSYTTNEEFWEKILRLKKRSSNNSSNFT